jgi:hypothetical protein
LVRESLKELRKQPTLPRYVHALVEVVDLHEPDDNNLKNRWQRAIDGLRGLYHASPVGTARQRGLLLDVAQDQELVAAMRVAVVAAGDTEPTWTAVFFAEGSAESLAVIDRFRDHYAKYPGLLERLATFALR